MISEIFAELLCDKESDILLRFRIAPIKFDEYYFVVCKKEEELILKYSRHKRFDFAIFLRERYPQGVSFDFFVENIVHTEEFIGEYKKHFCMEKKITPEVEELIYKIKELDFSVPEKLSGGFDGFSLEWWVPECKKVRRVWCVHSDEYYKPLTDLANIFLDIADADSEYRFIFYKKDY